MSTWKRFNETFLPDKKEFYSSLNMQDITDADHKHSKIIWKDFRIKNVGEYHDLYIQTIPNNLQMHLKVFATSVMKNMSLIRLIFLALGPA